MCQLRTSIYLTDPCLKPVTTFIKNCKMQFKTSMLLSLGLLVKGKEGNLTTHSTHCFIFTVIWRQIYGKGPLGYWVSEKGKCNKIKS